MKSKKYYLIDDQIMTEWQVLRAGFNLWDGKARYLGSFESLEKCKKKMKERGIEISESK